jgi:hypothetical protein
MALLGPKILVSFGRSELTFVERPERESLTQCRQIGGLPSTANADVSA